ncbi:hypothetical protein [Prolixibacter sp. NT017]|uniref:hypothetical protein n=1 Tax=Prolixibacter sp. NT017 TaxID=2652390 RepID=UPI0012884B36|nr:hypothetical protein [Prolixibacter sp. NT017]GET25890.1 hypothetical protein NT017_22190 [Prolixibacter sp. NT017]
MNWISYPANKPEKSGPYVVSISRPVENGDYTFSYKAYYSAETDRWFKYNPFSDEKDVLEEITFKINGWIQNLPAYLG